MSLARQSLFLGVTFVFILIAKLFFEGLSVPLIGVLVFVYLLLYRYQSKQKDTRVSDLNQLSVIMLTGVVLLLVFSTGGLDSYVFFLLSFIPFALAFVLLPETVFVYLIGVILLFLLAGLGENVTENIIKLGALSLLSPLAYFFGKEYKVIESHQRKDDEIARKISEDAANILRDQAPYLPEKDKQQLAEIIAESEQLTKEDN